MTSPDYWPKAIRALSKADPLMKQLIDAYRGELLQSRGDAFYTLARSIVGQQISVKAADSVWNKIIALANDAALHPAWVMDQSDSDLRACGLSGQKVTYLREIAGFFFENKVDEHYFSHLSDEEVIRHLTRIKGIGKWTAEMFLIFHLMRPDVFPLDDIGLQKGIEKRYHHSLFPHASIMTPTADGITKKDFYNQLLDLSEMWKPYRSAATWYLWRSLDPIPVAY